MLFQPPFAGSCDTQPSLRHEIGEDSFALQMKIEVELKPADDGYWMFQIEFIKPLTKPPLEVGEREGVQCLEPAKKTGMKHEHQVGGCFGVGDEFLRGLAQTGMGQEMIDCGLGVDFRKDL